jgi:hypothetical protein
LFLPARDTLSHTSLLFYFGALSWGQTSSSAMWKYFGTGSLGPYDIRCSWHRHRCTMNIVFQGSLSESSHVEITRQTQLKGQSGKE